MAPHPPFSAQESISPWLDEKDIRVHSSVSDCVREADFVVTATFAKEPILMRSYLKEGCHVMAVGAAR